MTNNNNQNATDKLLQELEKQLVPAIIKASISAVGRGTKWIYDKFRWNLELPGDRKKVLRSIFLGNGEFLFQPSMSWHPASGQDAPPEMQSGYPHDLEAIRAFDLILPGRTFSKATLFFPEAIKPLTRLVSTGSPKANSAARIYLPLFEETQKDLEQKYKTLLKPEDLHYNFMELPGRHRVNVYSMMRGSLSLKTQKALRYKVGGEWREWQPAGYSPDKYGDMLKKDFLLVSRLPRTREGGDVLLLSGAHGCGTESIQTLFRKLDIGPLRDLENELRGANYYQFVVEVVKLRHLKKGTKPVTVRICEELPPKRLEITSDILPNPKVDKNKGIWASAMETFRGIFK